MPEELAERARELLEANTQTAVRDGRTFVFSVPSVRAYPFQWFWDSCFHAIVWARFDTERAKEELRGFVAHQEPDGFIPHVLFWNAGRMRRSPLHWHYLETRDPLLFLPWRPKPPTSAHMQPPVLAQAVERVVEASGDAAFLAEALPVLERYHRWLLAARDPDGDGLVSIIAQFESGLDFSPAYDVGGSSHPAVVQIRARWPELVNKLRYRYDLGRIFRHAAHHQEDVLVNAVHGDALESLARLAERGGRPELAEWAHAQASRVVEALLERSWDPAAGLFWNLRGPDESPSRRPTVISLAPLMLPLPPEVAGRLVEHLVDPREFWAPFPVPSVSLAEPSFAPGTRIRGHRLIWRGPTSMNTNWLLVRGLRRHGFADVADRIAERSRELARASGFNEFYDPENGRPVGAERFGWATLAVDL
jgi:glycogen debranching enzyme